MREYDVPAEKVLTEFKTLEIPTPSARLFVKDYGGDGPAVLLLHGGPGVPDYLDPVAQMLTGRLRVITYDQRGVGKSTSFKNNYEVGDYLEDLEAVRSHLGLDSFHLFGHSWGGLLAQLYAKAHPERIRSLFLCDSAYGVGTDWKRTQDEVMKYNRRQSGFLGFAALGLWYIFLMFPNGIGDYAARQIMRRVWRNYFLEPDEAPEPDKDWLRGVKRNAMVRTSKSLLVTESTAIHPRNTITGWPVLILYTRYDIYGAGKEIVYSRFPQAQKAFLENSGHLPWLQDVGEFAGVLREFYAL